MAGSKSEQSPDRPDAPTSHLVRRVREGDWGPFNDLYARLAAPIYAWASLRIPPPLRARLDAEDLVQEVWRRAIEHLRSYDPAQGAFRAWMFGIARHVLLKALRALRAQPALSGESAFGALDDLPAEVTSVTKRVARREDLRRFVDVVGSLDDEEQTLLLLRGLESRPLLEVGDMLGISVEAAKKRWQRLRQRLMGMPVVLELLEDEAGGAGA